MDVCAPTKGGSGASEEGPFPRSLVAPPASVPIDFLIVVSVDGDEFGLSGRYGCVHVAGDGRGVRCNRRGCHRFGLGAHFVAAEVAAFVFGGTHFRHGGVGLRVVVIGVPEEKADAAFLFRDLGLNLNVLGRVRLGAPGKGLQPGTNHHAAVFGDELEAVHGLADEMLGRVAGARDAVHAEEVRRIDHGRKHVAVLGHGYDILPGVRKIDGTLPRHDSENIKRQQNAGGVNLGIGAINKTRDYLRARLFGVLALEVELGIFLVAFSGEADVVKLHFIDSRLGYELGQGYVVVLHLRVRGVGPDQFAVLAPGLAGAVRLDRQFRMGGDQMLVAEHGDASDGVHVLGMQEVNELGQVGNIVALSGGQRMVKGDVDDAVAILDIEHDRVAANFAPVLDDAHSMIAAGHDAGQVNGADFEISCNWDSLLYNGRF